MFDANEVDFPNWENLSFENRPKPKTSHSLSEVPLMIYDPRDISANWKLRQNEKSFYGLANIAATATLLMGLDPGDRFEEAIIEKTKR
jgi:bisphosphoglycerate-independent phosphoglycerate mutase (AlkP superfamily)